MPSNIIAILWDFDKTLISGYMQEPLFEYYGIDPVQFWDEVNSLPEFHAQDEGGIPFLSDSLYLNHILTYVREGIFHGLNNSLLRQFGKDQRLAPGVPEIFEHINCLSREDELLKNNSIQIEHYAISTGLRQIILGSRVAPYMRHVWGCEFLSRVAPPGYLKGREAKKGDGTICDIGYIIDHTTKTRAIFEINKGVRENPEIDVNMNIPEEKRRIPFQNMIYVADGPSDIPSLSVIKRYGGRTIGVYQPESEQELLQAKHMLEQGRVHWIGPADYRPASPTYTRLLQEVKDIAHHLAERSCRDHDQTSGEAVELTKPPRHIY